MGAGKFEDYMNVTPLSPSDRYLKNQILNGCTDVGSLTPTHTEDLSAGRDAGKLPWEGRRAGDHLAHLADLHASLNYWQPFPWLSMPVTVKQRTHLDVRKLDELLRIVVPPVVGLHVEHAHVARLQALQHGQHLPGDRDVGLVEVVVLHLQRLRCSVHMHLGGGGLIHDHNKTQQSPASG